MHWLGGKSTKTTTYLLKLLPATGLILSLLTLDLSARQLSSDAITALVNSIDSSSFQISNCADYPYHINDNVEHGPGKLLKDIRQGLATGLQCLSGHGEMGRLHAYHENNALRLAAIVSGRAQKQLQCVRDELFAVAIADSTSGQHYRITIDTFRAGGLLSKRHEDEVYRAFFNLNPAQIREHKTGSPLRLDGLHRMQDTAALMFHEMVHWLGEEHSGIYPDVTHLYETCCFGGSDFIRDEKTNQRFQLQACAILQDDELWSAPTRYQQMVIWNDKDYDDLKTEMRAQYE